MKTKLIEINPNRPALSVIKKAVQIIREGGIIVIPTDTVYGLVCDATNPEAIRKLYQIKKRPYCQPLSIALSDLSYIYKYVESYPDLAEKLAKTLLPGPLTIVLKKSSLIPDIVTAGRSDIGIRIPDSKIVLMLIKLVRRPIVIPSANVHRRPSPITAEQALRDLDGKVDLILDGGKTKYGIESTVVSLINNKIKILREGAISAKEIFSCLK